MAKQKAQLQPEIAALFTIVGDFSRCHQFGDFGEVDFNTLSIERVSALIQGGFPYLKERILTKTEPISEIEAVETANVGEVSNLPNVTPDVVNDPSVKGFKIDFKKKNGD